MSKPEKFLETNFELFLRQIKREDLDSVVTQTTPWAYFSQEIYNEQDLGIKGAGGLGVLAADTARVAQKLDIPLIVVTPFYSSHIHQALFDFWHSEHYETLRPRSFGFDKIADFFISTSVDPVVPLEIYEKQMGSVRVIAPYEPNIGPLYSGETGSDHRLYQEVLNGFGGYKFIKQTGFDPSALQLNESPTVFAAIAQLDDYLDQNADFCQALESCRRNTIYTNHTLLQAAEGDFHISQFEHFVFPNIRNVSVINWVRQQFRNDERIKLSTLAIELSGHKNGVSILHAKLSSSNYVDKAGNPAHFDAVTNGISNHWILDEIVAEYKQAGIIDDFGLPSDDFLDKLDTLDIDQIRKFKQIGRAKMNEMLSRRQDQYGNPIYIPENAKLFDFKRRMVDYKRVRMVFEDPDRLAGILYDHNAHFIFSGKPPGGDTWMLENLRRFLQTCGSNPILKERVHYVQDYDEEVGLALALGSDCAINVPVVGQEACGTSWMKDIANCKLLISTTDGGVADISPANYLEVKGTNYQEETSSMYEHMRTACEILNDDMKLRLQIFSQLRAYIPIISGARMIKDYLNLRFQR